MTSLDPHSEILDIHGEPIDPIWAAEFRGFFWGEGTIAILCGRPDANRPTKSGKPRQMAHYSIAITASIGLRSDDAALLYELQRRLGGQITLENYRDGSGKTVTRWKVGVAADNLRVARLLESPTGLPFNKAKQLTLWRKAVEAKLRAGGTPGSRYVQEDRDFIVYAAQELVRMRKWVG